MSAAKWVRITPTSLNKIPDVIGVYAIGNADKKIIYIGEGRINDRINSHLKKPLFKDAVYFIFEVTNSKRRAQQRERVLHRIYLAKYHMLPKYNKHLGEV